MHRVVTLNTLSSIASIYFSTQHNRFFSEPVVLCGKIKGSNATESVRSDHPVHGHTPLVVLFSAVLTELL